LACEIGLTIGEIGVAEAIVNVGRIGIGEGVELEELDGGLGVASLQRFVAEAVHDGFGEDDFFGETLAGFGEESRGFGGVGGIVEKIEEVILVFSERGSERGRNGGMRAEGVGEPGDDVSGEILVEGEKFNAVAAFGEMLELVDGVGGETVDPFHEFDDAGIGIVVGDGSEEG